MIALPMLIDVLTRTPCCSPTSPKLIECVPLCADEADVAAFAVRPARRSAGCRAARLYSPMQFGPISAMFAVARDLQQLVLHA